MLDKPEPHGQPLYRYSATADVGKHFNESTLRQQEKQAGAEGEKRTTESI